MTRGLLVTRGLPVTRGLLVAIDGPAGSGKSTIARAVAERLGIEYLDTGAMYRALTWYCLENDVELADETAVRAAADQLDFRSEPGSPKPRFFAGEDDITTAIREPRIAGNVSVVARNLAVREWMKLAQRQAMLRARAAGTGMVAEGRDITTVVCPDADVRVLLTADEETRIRRRTIELYGKDTPEFRAATEKQIGARDRSDSTVADFLAPSPGVVAIDSSDLSIEQVVARVVGMVPANEPDLGN